jgi:hypothetical protein
MARIRISQERIDWDNLELEGLRYYNGFYHVDRGDIWGNYSPFTGEYYLNSVEGVIASGYYDENDNFIEQSYDGWNYNAVRRALMLGH